MEKTPFFFLANDQASNPRFNVTLPKYDEWATSVEDIPQDLDEDTFEDWLWCRSKELKKATESGKDEGTKEPETKSTSESEASKKKKKNRKNKQRKRDKKKNKSQQPEKQNTEPAESPETKTNSADDKKQQGASGPFANLRSLRSFPTFAGLPEEDLVDLSFYRDMLIGYAPRRHWCFLGEIVDIVPAIRLNHIVKDASGEELLLAFYTDGRGHEVEQSRIRIGNTVAVLYANRHDFVFSPTCIRHEEPSDLAVCLQSPRFF